MDMPPQVERSDVRIGGQDLNKFTTAFASKFLSDMIEYRIEVQRIRRSSTGSGWELELLNHSTSSPETRHYDRLGLCTGVRLPSSCVFTTWRLNPL